MNRALLAAALALAGCTTTPQGAQLGAIDVNDSGAFTVGTGSGTVGADDAGGIADAGAGDGGFGPTGTATVNGSVNSVALQPADAQSSTYLTIRGGTVVSGLSVAVTSYPAACEVLGLEANQASSTQLVFVIENQGPNEQPAIIPGDFPVNPAPTPDANGNQTLVTALFEERDPTCATLTPPSAQVLYGSITVTALDAQHAAGTFDVEFSAGELTGSFDAPLCGFPPAAVEPPDGGAAAAGCIQ